MRKIQIVGPGCANCNRLAENAEAAAKELGIEFEVEKVTDVVRFAELGIIMTPGLIVEGVVKSSGKVLSPAEIKVFLR